MENERAKTGEWEMYRSALKRAYGDGYAAGQRERWISVDDELPNNDDHVLCCTVNAKGKFNIVIGYYMSGAWRCGMNSNVKYWMPLPEPPEVEK